LRCRMDRAKDFPKNWQLTVGQVAEATGFADLSHSGKLLRRFVGVTPVQFRARV
jgi:transcriptional regulator GlxA family with amidase domain